MPTIFLGWDDNNQVEQGYYVYRSQEPIDIENPPIPIATLPRDAVRLEDNDNSLIPGIPYYYMVGAFINDYILFSDVIEFIPSDNMVYAITSDNKVVQFHEGNVSWSVDVGEGLLHIFIADDNKIYVSTVSNKVNIYNANTGELVDVLQFHQRIVDIATTLDQTKLCFISNAGRVFITENPSLKHITSIIFGGSSNYRNVAVTNDYVYIGNGAGNVSQYDLLGNHQWDYDIIGTIRGMVSVENGVVFGDNSAVVRIDESGSEVWSTNVGSTITHVATDRFSNIVVSSGSTIHYITNSGSKVWDTTLSTIQDLATDISGQIFAVSDNNVNLITINGDAKDTITDELVNSVSLSTRARQPEVYTPVIAGVYHSTNDVTGVEENTAINLGGVRGEEYSITQVYSDTGNVVSHTSENIIRSNVYSITHGYNVQP